MKKWLKYLIAILLVLIVSIYLVFDLVLEKALKAKLQSLVKQNKESIYDYEFDKLDIGFVSGDIVMTDLRIIPRQNVIDSLALTGDIRKQIFSARLAKFRLEGLNSWKLLLNDEIHITALVFDHPDITIYINKNAPIASGKAVAKDIIVPGMSYVQIDSLLFIGARFEIINIREDTVPALSLDSASLSVYAIRTDSAMLASGEILTYESIELDVNSIRVESMKDYSFGLKRIFNDPVKRVIFLEGFTLSPRLDKYEFMKTQVHETDWFSISVKRIELHQPDRELFAKEGILSFATVLIDELDLELYRDKRLPDGPVKVKKLPSAAIRKIDLPMHLPNIVVQNSKIRYLEWEEKGVEPLQVWFEKTTVEITNFTTVEEKLKENDSLKLDISTSFMGKASVKATFELPILDTSDLFTMRGRVEHLDFKALNPLLQHGAFVKFEEGKVNFIEFDFSGDDIQSLGWLDIDYKGLKGVRMMRNKEELMAEKEEKRDKKEGKRFLSFLANTVIPNDYGPQSENYYTGEIKYVRDRNKSVFNFLVRSIQSGIMTSLIPAMQGNYKQVKKEKKDLKKEAANKEKSSRKKGKNNSVK